MSSSLIPLFKNLGLSEKEIRVFYSLLKRGSSSASQIAENTEISRTNIYNITDELKKRGLVSEVEESGVKTYQALDHVGLMAYISRKQKELNLLEKNFMQAAEIFHNLQKQSTPKTKVRMFEGQKGIRNIYEEIRNDLNTMTEHSELLTIFSPKRIEKGLPGWLENEEYIDVPSHFIKKSIIADSEITQQYLTKIRRSSGQHVWKLWPQEMKDFPIDTVCWCNKITYVDLSSKHPSGILIENEPLVETFTLWFQRIWDSL